MTFSVGLTESSCSASHLVHQTLSYVRQRTRNHILYSGQRCLSKRRTTHTQQASRCRSAVRVAAGLKIIESYDGKFDLAKDAEDALKQLLASSTFAKQVVQETGQPEGTEVTYTGILFQPVPWSMQTKKGMPAEFEKYAADPDYVIINTPPNFMFQAKIFKPSRLCAIYKKK